MAETISNTGAGSSAASSEDENSRSPEQNTRAGIWECEPIYYSMPGKNDKTKSRRGKAYRDHRSAELTCFEAHDGVIYKPGDYVYLEVSTSEPYNIGTIQGFKTTKRDQLNVKVTRYFRPDDVPEVSVSLLLQDRSVMDFDQNKLELRHSREIFSSETSGVHPIGTLRGKCEIKQLRDIRSEDCGDLSRESFFVCCLSYHPDTSRLAPIQGEIRVGSAYQAKLPSEPSCSLAEEGDRDELLYRPDAIAEESEANYVKLSRTFRVMSLTNSMMTETERSARLADRVLDDAIVTLHRCGYNVPVAINEMSANDKLLSTDVNYMTAEDTKKFGKGIKTYGKNFVKISKEMLPLHTRDQLVGFYYLWKKTNDATKPKPVGRVRNPVNSSKRANKNGFPKASRPGSTELHDYASASESEVESSESDGRPVKYACHHCYESKSRDWHHAGRDNLLLCTECRVFYKKYGQYRPVDRPSTVPPCLFKRNSSGDEEEELGVRTRAGKKERRQSPNMGDERRSPSQAQSIHEFDLEKRPLHKNGKRKRGQQPPQTNGTMKKRIKEDERDREGEDADSGEDKFNHTGGDITMNGDDSLLDESRQDEMEEDDKEDKKELNGVRNEMVNDASTVDNNTAMVSVAMDTVQEPTSYMSTATSSSTTSLPTLAVSPSVPPSGVMNTQPQAIASPTTGWDAPREERNGVYIVNMAQHGPPTHEQMIVACTSSSSTATTSTSNTVLPSVSTTVVQEMAPSNTIQTVDDEGNEEIFVLDEPEEIVEGNEIVHSHTNSNFILKFKWKSGQRSARTDLMFKTKDDSTWNIKRREAKERASRPVTVSASPATTIAQKKDSTATSNVIGGMQPSMQDMMAMALGGGGRTMGGVMGGGMGNQQAITPQLLMQMLQQQHLEQQQQQQHMQQQQQQQAVAAAAAAQHQQMVKLMEMRNQQQRGSGGGVIGPSGPFPGMGGPGIGGMGGHHPFEQLAAMDPAYQQQVMHMMAAQHHQQQQIQQQQQQQQQAQQQAQAAAVQQAAQQQMMAALQQNPAAFGVAPDMMHLMTLGRNAEMQALLQASGIQQMMSMSGPHPLMNTPSAASSDMMRRLQHESFRPPQ